MQAILCTVLCFCFATLHQGASAKLVQQTWTVQETLTNYFMPWDRSQHSLDAPFTTYSTGQMRMALLANDSLPGPLITAELGDEIEITVNNLSQTEVVDIHWHGMPQMGTPWADGAYMISGCGIPALTGSFTYRFTAQIPGTRFWHSHVQHQMEWGLFGPLIVQDPADPYSDWYDEEVVIMFHEWWSNPDVLQIGSPLNVNDFRVHLVNGVFGNGTDSYPYYMVQVVPHMCYRMRFIAVMGEDVGYRMTIAGHTMDIIAVDGQNVKKTRASSIVFYIGSRYDVILCADQKPGNYLVEFESVEREEILMQLPPVMKFGFVISYNESAAEQQHTLGNYLDGDSPPPTLDPESDIISRQDHSGLQIDVNKAPDMIQDLRPSRLPPVTADPITIYLGATTHDSPLEMWGFKGIDQPNALPHSPLLFTKGRCGTAKNTRVIELSNGTVVDIIVNNLMDEVHPQHLHGNNFWVLGSGYKLLPNISDSETLAPPDAGACRRPNSTSNLAPSPANDPLIGDTTAPIPLQVWGCPYNNETDWASLSLVDPYVTDTVMVPARSWAVMRVAFNSPGVWPFHCHKLYHMRLGMEMYFNIGPDVQPPIPAHIYSRCSPCGDAQQPGGFKKGVRSNLTSSAG